MKPTVVVTGAASGIGRAIALAFAAQGDDVIAVDIDEPGLSQLATEGLQIEAVDVTNESAVKELFDRARNDRPEIRALCNAAGILIRGTVVDTPLEAYERIMGVNVRGTFLMCKHALPVLADSGGGSIVNIASANSFIAEPAIAVYCASKAAVAALTRSLALDHAHEGIRANAICPGFIDTPMVRQQFGDLTGLDFKPINFFARAGRPEEIAQVAVFLASNQASFITGATIAVDGGATAM